MKSSGDDQRPGLRERKKARTRAAIKEHAFRLFRDQGYDETTVDQIAEAADVSPSTFFRYYPTKEDVVFQDEFDLIAIGSLFVQPAGLSIVAAIRAAFKQALASVSEEMLAGLQEQAALILNVPELRARAMDEFIRTIDVIAEAVAERSGRERDNFEARTVAGAIVGVIMAATMPWSDWEAEPPSRMFERIDAALAHLEAGLPL